MKERKTKLKLILKKVKLAALNAHQRPLLVKIT